MTETPLRIVIAEDDEKLATLIEELLTRDSRFVVVARASDGNEAVRLAEQHRPDLVLMDIGLPGRDGIDATRAIHAWNSVQHVVIYTGSGEYDDIARADAAGAIGFLHKDALVSPDLADALHVLHTNFTGNRPDD